MAAAAVAPAAAAGLAEVSLARSDYSELMEEKSYFHRKGIPESSRSGGGTSACTARSRDSVLDGLLSLRDVHVSQQLSQSSTWPSEANGVWPTLTEFSGLPSEVDLRGRESSLSGAVTPPWPSLHPSDKGAMDEGDDDDDAHATDRLAELDEQVWPSAAASDVDGLETVEALEQAAKTRVLTPFEVAQLDAVFETSIKPLLDGVSHCMRCKDASVYALESPRLCFHCTHFPHFPISRCAVRGRPSRYLLTRE